MMYQELEQERHTLPNSIESEQAVLGALLIDNDAIDRCAGLSASMFFDRKNGKIYESVARLLKDNKAADVVTVYEDLTSRGLAQQIGGIAYLADLVQHTPSAANIRRYADIVHDRHIERQMLIAAQEIKDLAVEKNGRSLTERRIEALRLMEVVEGIGDKNAEKTASEALQDLMHDMARRMDMAEGELGGLSTGIKAMDALLDGLRPGELIVIGGRPSMGKSVIAEMIARTNAKAGKVVRVQSYEMPARDWMARSAAADQGIPLSHIRAATLNKDDFASFSVFVTNSANWKLTIDDDAAALEHICLRARSHKRKHGLDLLILDHLHLIPRPGKNETAELGEITSTLKRLAIDLQTPVVLLSQLNRLSSTGVPRAPSLSDLRGSGSIEQDADVVIFPHRPYYYDANQPPGEAQWILAKHRNGPIGVVNLGWHGAYVRFEENVTDWRPVKPNYYSGNNINYQVGDDL